jgi:secretion/DNA translocation related TadE-like protein
MLRSSKSESGQISILVLVIAVAFLFGTFVIGMVAEVLVAQQRLNAKAEAIALAGAQELEFNVEESCAVAKEFGILNFGLLVDCATQGTSIEIHISESSPNQLLSVFLPNIEGSSRAGIASGE